MRMIACFASVLLVAACGSEASAPAPEPAVIREVCIVRLMPGGVIECRCEVTP